MTLSPRGVLKDYPCLKFQSLQAQKLQVLIQLFVLIGK